MVLMMALVALEEAARASRAWAGTVATPSPAPGPFKERHHER